VDVAEFIVCASATTVALKTTTALARDRLKARARERGVRGFLNASIEAT
jgi:hypothetical protein